ncbi:hypothetical protein ACQY0O_001043 [Thecaphora frezii]
MQPEQHRPPPPTPQPLPLPTHPSSASPPVQPFLLPYKRSQRPSWSCTECARRKIKCDKKIPCSSCIKRNCPERCRLEGTTAALVVANSTPVVEPVATLPHSSAATQYAKVAPHPESHPDPNSANGDSTNGYGGRRSRQSSRTASYGAVAKSSPRQVGQGLPGDYYAATKQPHVHSPASLVTPSQAASAQGPLERIRQQLSRIEERLAHLESRDASIGNVHARIQDVEEIISLMGDERISWEKRRNRHLYADEVVGAVHPDTHRTASEPRRSHSQEGSSPYKNGATTHRERSPTAKNSFEERSRCPGSATAAAEQTTAARLSERRMSDEEIEAWRGNRNAELAAEDAATALEFVALGKDRRQGLIMAEVEAEVQLGSEGEQASDSVAVPYRAKAPIASAEVVSGSVPQASDQTAVGERERFPATSHASDAIRRSFPAIGISLSTQVKLDLIVRDFGDHVLPSNILKRPTERRVPDSIVSFALPAASIRPVIRLAKEIGAWQHCCVHFPTFEREVEAFLVMVGNDHHGQESPASWPPGQARRGHVPDEANRNAWSMIDPAWLSLFFVIVSIAIHQMCAEESRDCGIQSGERQNQLASSLLGAAMDSLSLADYLVRPSVYCCQTIAVLCVAGHNICGSDLLTSLLAIGIKTGQTLNLHALGRTSRFLEESMAKRKRLLEKEQTLLPDAGPGKHPARQGCCRLKDESSRQFATWKKRIVDLEVGKRVWWAFTQQDYFAIPYRGCFSIFEGQYDTPLPHNCSDEDLEDGRLINRDVCELTVASKQRYTCFVAKIVCDFFKDLNKSHGAVDLSLVLHHERRLRQVTDKFTKSCLKTHQTSGISEDEKGKGRTNSNGNDRSGLPSYASVIQHYLFISVHHKIIVMHRAFLSRKVSPEDRQLSHEACIETARAILHQLERGLGLRPSEGEQPDLRSRAHGGALWTIPYHAVAAATILALDMLRICKNSSENEGFDEDAEEKKRVRRDEVQRAQHALSSFTSKSAIAQRGCQLLAGLLDEGKKWDDRKWANGKRKVVEHHSLKAAKRSKGDEPWDTKTAIGARHIRTPSQVDKSGGDIDGSSRPPAADHACREAPRSPESRPGPSSLGDLAALESADLWYSYGSNRLNPLAGDATSRTNPFIHGLSSTSPTQVELSDLLATRPPGQGSIEAFATTPSSLSTASPFAFDTNVQQPPPHQQGQQHQGTHPYAPTPTFEAATPSIQPNHSHQHQHQQQQHQLWPMDLGVGTNQQLTQILPALESMPDVWRLFDGSLGSNLLEFQESGF